MHCTTGFRSGFRPDMIVEMALGVRDAMSAFASLCEHCHSREQFIGCASDDARSQLKVPLTILGIWVASQAHCDSAASHIPRNTHPYDALLRYSTFGCLNGRTKLLKKKGCRSKPHHCDFDCPDEHTLSTKMYRGTLKIATLSNHGPGPQDMSHLFGAECSMHTLNLALRVPKLPNSFPLNLLGRYSSSCRHSGIRRCFGGTRNLIFHWAFPEMPALLDSISGPLKIFPGYLPSTLHSCMIVQYKSGGRPMIAIKIGNC